MAEVRILLLADSHIGFDLPERPRVSRRRRGYDILANYEKALEPARAGEVDVVVHGGDVFDRPRISTGLAYRALEPLLRVARRGVPVFIVPGNHERSMLPHQRLLDGGVHVFDRPRTFVVDVRDKRIGLSGFPYERRRVRERFPALVEATGWASERAEVRLLCVHHCVEGATVGPGQFTFTTAADVIRARDIPADFDAVLSGHIHRHQVLTSNLRGRPLAAPVLYPGSLERLSIAEIGEPKGFIILRADCDSGDVSWEFRRLHARPMIVRDIAADGMSAASLHDAVRALIAAAPADAVLKIRIAGELSGVQLQAIVAERVRPLVPESMNVEIRAGEGRRFGRRLKDHSPRSEHANLQLDLGSA